MLKLGYWEVCIYPPISHEDEDFTGADVADSFLKNVYMSTNVQDRTVSLSARTDSPLSSSFGKASLATSGSTNTSASGEPLGGTAVTNGTNDQVLKASQESAALKTKTLVESIALSAFGIVVASCTMFW